MLLSVTGNRMEKNGSPFRTNVQLPREVTLAVCSLGSVPVRKQCTPVWLQSPSVSTGNTRLPNTDL